MKFFPLSDAYKYGVEISKTINSRILGRAIFPTSHDAGILAQAVANGLHGDHVEIGTLFGGTAILAAMIKKEFGLHGKVYCVDPLEFRPEAISDKGTGYPATSRIFKENVRKFSVEDKVVYIPQHSYPWPLPDMVFATGYLDGDHWGKNPAQDWKSLSRHVTYSIILNDYMPHKPDIIDVVSKAASDPQWILVHISGVNAVFRRRH